MKPARLIIAALAIFVIGVWAAPRIDLSLDLTSLPWTEIARWLDYWASRYQTFLGILVAIFVARRLISALTTQSSLYERHFLFGRLQQLLNDSASLRLVMSQLDEIDYQRDSFENAISVLEMDVGRHVGASSADSVFARAYANVEDFRSLVSQTTAKFVGLTSGRAALIERLDAILSSQENMRIAYAAWAVNNIKNELGPGQPVQEKVAYLQLKQRTMGLWTDLRRLASDVIHELNTKIGKIDSEISSLETALKTKAVPG